MSEKAQNPDPEAVAVGNVVDGSSNGSPNGSSKGSPNGAPMGPAANQESAPEAAKQPPSVSDMVDQPAKVLRIGTMVKQLLDEVKSAPLDDAARARLAEIHQSSITELEEGLAPELVEELRRLSLPFASNVSPSDAELRIAHAQLVGWLEGLFHGIQAAQAAQAMASQQTAARLAMRQLPPGTMIAPGVIVGENGEPQRASAGHGSPLAKSQLGGPDSGGPGQYL